MDIKQRLDKIRLTIAQSELEAGRKPGSVLLLAVSKQQSLPLILEAHALGVCDFGESYLQEALQKINQLKSYPLCWHFIGPIQSNKAKNVATSFDWVHSINRSKIAKALNEHRPADWEPLNVCLHINLEDEPSKSGIPPEQAAELTLEISQLPHLKLRGLMTIPPPEKTDAELFCLFNQLQQLMHTLNKDLGLNMDTLSMGMSDDIVPAIKAGSTIVRIGRAIFGERQGKKT